MMGQAMMAAWSSRVFSTILLCCASIQAVSAGGEETQTGGPPRALELWPTPPQLGGRCSTVWTSSVGKYDLPYRVDFGDTGSFRWWAPILAGGMEVGNGVFLSAPRTIVKEGGSWEVSYFGANRFTPDPANSTNCCCEYVGEAGPGQPRVLADYCVAAVPNTAHLPMEEVCAPHVRHCPRDNVTALQTMGKPFIEIYSPCVPLGSAAWLGRPAVIAALVTTFVVIQFVLLLRRRFSTLASTSLVQLDEEGYHAMEAAPSWLKTFLKTGIVRAQPPPAEV